MGNALSVSVVALDPVLEAGAASTLGNSPEVALALPNEPAGVAVVIVDQVDRRALDLVTTTREQEQRPEVVLVATELVAAEARQAITAGVAGLLRRREVTTDRLVRTVLTAAGGDCTMSADLLDELLEHREDTARPYADGPGLSDRERTVLRLVAEGRETEEIARELCYSVRTVTTVLRDITQRFRLRNRAHAVAFALRGGLL
ncbi:response regulator transcription factor [Kitasatospora sp. NPDC048545]|uniref:response regulator transcription factor n=1 Tax=unclassified Kitasatospora TaxID=2633591 RepID=UPI0033FF7423